MSQKLSSERKQKSRCAFCGKGDNVHSAELWDLHQKAIPIGAKIGSIQLGFGPRIPAQIVEWNAKPPYDIEYIPIHMHCSDCNSAMSSSETDLADVLSGLCLKCFSELTDQEYSWHSVPWWAVNGGKYQGGEIN